MRLIERNDVALQRESRLMTMCCQMALTHTPGMSLKGLPLALLMAAQLYGCTTATPTKSRTAMLASWEPS